MQACLRGGTSLSGAELEDLKLSKCAGWYREEKGFLKWTAGVLHLPKAAKPMAHLGLFFLFPPCSPHFSWHQLVPPSLPAVSEPREKALQLSVAAPHLGWRAACGPLGPHTTGVQDASLRSAFRTSLSPSTDVSNSRMKPRPVPFSLHTCMDPVSTRASQWKSIASPDVQIPFVTHLRPV